MGQLEEVAYTAATHRLVLPRRRMIVSAVSSLALLSGASFAETASAADANTSLASTLPAKLPAAAEDTGVDV